MHDRGRVEVVSAAAAAAFVPHSHVILGGGGDDGRGRRCHSRRGAGNDTGAGGADGISSDGTLAAVHCCRTLSVFVVAYYLQASAPGSWGLGR
jgi:hypothetical protein